MTVAFLGKQLEEVISTFSLKEYQRLFKGRRKKIPNMMPELQEGSKNIEEECGSTRDKLCKTTEILSYRVVNVFRNRTCKSKGI